MILWFLSFIAHAYVFNSRYRWTGWRWFAYVAFWLATARMVAASRGLEAGILLAAGLAVIHVTLEAVAERRLREGTF